MAKYRERLKAISLRKKGFSVGEIAKSLNVSKSSVSVWTSDINLSRNQRLRIRDRRINATNKGRLAGVRINKEKKIRAINDNYLKAKKDVGPVTDRELTLVASALFWAEGSKTQSRFVFVNSDPEMILLVYRFLKDILKVDKDRIFITIQINESHKPRIKKVLRFWSNLLKLPLSSFGKPYYIKVKPKKIYSNYDSYYGIARLQVRKGTDLQYYMLGLIKAIKEDVGVA